MPTYSKEKKEMLLSMLRFILDKETGVTVRGATKIMREERCLLSKNYVHKLMKVIFREQYAVIIEKWTRGTGIRK